MGKRDRVRLAAGMLLSVSAVCTVLLTLCAGGNAAAVFAAREAAVQQTASPAPQGPLAGLVVAVDAGHGGYDGGTDEVFGRDEFQVIALALQLAVHRREQLRVGQAHGFHIIHKTSSLNQKNAPVSRGMA